MVSISRKYKEAQERWIQHCHDIERSTAKIPKGTEQERKARITRAQKDYRYFVSTYFPHLATTECANFQVDAAVYMRDHENARGLFEWARGHAKSTHISLLQPLWLKIQPNARPLIMILVSKNQEAARRLLGDLQAELESNDLYNADFGNQRGTGIWTNGEFTTATGDLFIALGRGQSPRGIKKRGRRPNYIAVDDIDDDELVRNPRRVGEAVDWLLTALLGTMAMGRGRLAVVGNRIGRTSVISTLADNPRFHHTVVNALAKKGLPSWPQNYTSREIAEMRGIMGERRFQREYMNNPVNAGTTFEEKNIRFGKMLHLREYRGIICYTDPSFKSSATADYKATMLIGLTPKGQYHLLKAYADQTKVSTMVEWHYEIHDYVGDNPIRYEMEAGFMQDLLLDEFRKYGEKVGYQIPIVGDTRKKPDKFARIEALQPLFERGDIIFNELERESQGMQVLVEQLLCFEKGSKINDDAPDALEGGIWKLSNSVRKINNRYAVGHRASRKW